MVLIRALFLLFLGLITLRLDASTGPPPVITVQPQSQYAPLLGIVTFSVQASSGTTMTYQWYFDGNAISGATSSSYTILTVLGTSSGVYFVKVTNAGGTTTSSNAYLNVTPPPGISTQPQSEAVNQGQSASFSVVASGTSPFSYQWFFNGSSMSGQTGSALSLSSVGPGNAGNYDVVVSNGGGSVTSAVVSLTVYVPPAIQSQPQNQTVVQGTNASFSVTANGSSPFSYQWYFGGSAISGATASSLALSNVQSNQSGSYTVMVSNRAGSTTSTSAALTVDVPAGITTQPQSQYATNGQSVTFSVVASGTAPLNYQWFFNGSTLPGQGNSSSATLNNVGTNDAGHYAVVVRNNWGAVTSSIVQLTVIGSPIITNQPQSQIALAGQTVTFSVGASSIAPVSYAWCFNGIPLPGATDSTLVLTNVSSAVAGSYTVVLTNIAGSITSAAASLTVTNPVVAPPLITSTAGMTPNGFAFQFAVPPGRTYVILASSDLLHWTPIETNATPTGTVSFTDSDSVNHQCRMYRVVVR